MIQSWRHIKQNKNAIKSKPWFATNVKRKQKTFLDNVIFLGSYFFICVVAYIYKSGSIQGFIKQHLKNKRGKLVHITRNNVIN